MTKVLVSLSGGMDSATLLGQVLSQGLEVECVGFTYGSKHNPYENRAALFLSQHYKVPFRLLDLSHVMKGFTSHLLKDGGDIPEGHYEDKSMSLTVVPGRNIIFASLLSGLAWSLGAKEVYLGIHQGDLAVYPDCRPSFFHAMKKAVWEGTDGRVNLQAPFLSINKTGILTLGLKLGVPYQLTRTCYTDGPTACGRCGACQERLGSFKENGLEDPLDYLSREILPKE